jgi:2',3'-cyclic-nucleotide 2'-phosphodiesterase (5'-nucleotidase family)
MGLTTETLLFETHPSISEYVEAHRTLPVAESLAHYLRDIGCDVVIALTHQGLKRDLDLAKYVPEIDVIVGGHSHTYLDEPAMVGDVIVTQDGKWGEDLGIQKLRFERSSNEPEARFKLAKMENEFVPLSPDKPEDDGMKAFIADFQRRFDAEMGKVICTAAHDFPVDKVRLEEIALADVICDAMRSVTDSDVVLFNGGNFRAPLDAGEVTYGDLYGVLPYDNFLMKITLSGERLRDCLEYAGLQYGDGGYPQVSGMSLVYVDMQLAGAFIGETPPTEFELDYESAEWTVAIPVNTPASGWTAIDNDAEYTMLTTDFLAIGGDGFPLSEDPYGPGYTGLEQRATFALWAGQQGVLSGGTDDRVQFIWVNMENPGLRD